ncbi:MAG: hypothetical protein ACRDPS_14020 [Nocardioides sp.]|uniref:hypothetical protein n=1 Tax=Nocardioides sp. TaxID=35761 RepID=UPI003D6BB704
MTYSTITGERDHTAQHSIWNGTTPRAKWQETSWVKRITAIATALVPVVVAVAVAIRKLQAGERR